MFDRLNEETKKPKRVVFLSVEGTKTEVCYFQLVEQFREQLGIEAIVHIEVLRKHDTKSDPNSVLELLEEYIQFRENKVFETELATLKLGEYEPEFIRSYLENSSSIPKKERNKFEAVLREERIDLIYLDFLNKYQGEDDAFGIVIDRDSGNHSVEQMSTVVGKCKEKNYRCFITNPCFEFWQLLHVSDVATEYSEQLDDILKNELDSSNNSFVSNLLYEKTGQRKAIQVKTFETHYLPNVDLAIERAKGFAPDDELIEKIGSNLGDLFELLRTG